MSEPFFITAPAKTNLHLRVLGKRDDGFHEIDTRMVRLSLADELTLRWTRDDRVDLTCSDENLPTGEENLVVKAVRAMEGHCGKRFSLAIDLKKNIPSGAGLGGGSSDAAAVLRAINEMAELEIGEGELAQIAAGIGSDVPFFVYNQSCDCRGRGEIVQPLEECLDRLPVVLIKPGFEISAAWSYQNFEGSKEIPEFTYLPQICLWGEMVNDLERPVFEKFPILGGMKSWLLGQKDVQAALMSGSGSTMLAVLRTGESGDSLEQRIIERYGKSTWTFVGHTL